MSVTPDGVAHMTFDLWLDDIDRLRRVAMRDLPAVAADLDSTAATIEPLTAARGAFGDVERSEALAQAYEQARAFMAQNSRAAGERVREVATALATIADTFAEVERKNDPTQGRGSGR